jgi:hypothetical protein
MLENRHIRVSQDFVSDIQDEDESALLEGSCSLTPERKLQQFQEIAKSNPLRSTCGDSGWFAIVGQDAAHVGGGDAAAKTTQRMFEQFRGKTSSNFVHLY